MSDQNKKILIIEDNSHLQLLFKSLLLQNNLECECASNGKEGIQLLAMDDSFDLILLDIMMPVMDGLTFLEKARDVLIERDIKVCMVTALGEFGKLVECLNRGAHDYIVKMVEEEVLINKISYLRDGSTSYKHCAIECDFLQSVRLRGRGDADVRVINISEDHIVFESEVEIALNEVVLVGEGALMHKFFDSEPFFMRCFKAEPLGRLYKISACFIGLSEERAREIRSKTMKLIEMDDVS